MMAFLHYFLIVWFILAEKLVGRREVRQLLKHGFRLLNDDRLKVHKLISAAFLARTACGLALGIKQCLLVANRLKDM